MIGFQIKDKKEKNVEQKKMEVNINWHTTERSYCTTLTTRVHVGRKKK